MSVFGHAAKANDKDTRSGAEAESGVAEGQRQRNSEEHATGKSGGQK